MTKTNKFEYQSYLLRLWRSSEGDVWRVLLEQVGSRQRHGFADLESLCVFLHTQTDPMNRLLSQFEEGDIPLG